MVNLTKYSSATNNKYFTDGQFNFESLSTITSNEFVSELQGKLLLLLNKIERLAIKKYDDESIKIYIYASHYNYTNNSKNYIILDC